MQVKDVRRHNLRLLARHVGGITALSYRLERSQSQISHVIGKGHIKNIGDKLAARIEQVFEKPLGWLDQLHEDVTEDSHTGRSAISTLPVLACKDIQSWLSTNEAGALNIHSIVTRTPFSSKAFAVRMEDDSMMGMSVRSISPGSILLVEPNYSIKSGDIVITKINNLFVCRQWLTENNRYYLKPLNLENYSVLESTIPFETIGAVKQVVIEFV